MVTIKIIIIINMLGALDEFCTMLVPSMHCSMILFFVFFMVIIVEVHS